VRLRTGVIGLALLAAAPGSALGATVMVTSRQPPPTPSQLPPQEIVVGFNIAVKDPAAAPSSWTVQEVVGGVPTGFPLPGGASSVVPPTNDPKTWRLSFAPLFLGSNATYRVTLSHVQPNIGGNTALPAPVSWDFTTLPEPGRAPGAIDGLSATVAEGGVALAWTEPVDFDRAGVTIFRKAGQTVPTTADEPVGTFPEGVTTAIDPNVQPGATYTYAAFPYDRDNPPNLGPPVLSSPVTVPAPPVQIAPPPASPSPSPTPTTPAPQPQSKKTITTSKLVLPSSSTLIKGTKTRLRWKRNGRAAYYNVQLFKGRRKLMSTFPSAASTFIPATLLRATGTYRLLIWSGLGARTLGRYERTPWVTKTLTVRTKAPAKKV
jgi:hypothetical protein